MTVDFGEDGQAVVVIERRRRGRRRRRQRGVRRPRQPLFARRVDLGVVVHLVRHQFRSHLISNRKTR